LEPDQEQNCFTPAKAGATITRTAGSTARPQVSGADRTLQRGHTGDMGQGFLVKKPQKVEETQKSKTKQNRKKQARSITYHLNFI